MSRRGLSAETDSVSTGALSGSNFSTVGWSIVLGRSGSTRFTRSRTSCAAMSASFSRRNEMMTCETPSDEFDRSSSMLLIVLTASSILSVISVSTSSGAAPGSLVVTTTVGKSTLGKRSSPSRMKAKAPTTVSERMMTVAKTGRRTEIDASHCMCRYLSCFEEKASARSARGDGLPVRHTSFRVGRDRFTLRDARGDLDTVAERFADRDDPLLDPVVLDDVDAAGAGDDLDGRRGNEERRSVHGLTDSRRREHARLQSPVGVRRERLDGERTLVGAQARRDEADACVELFVGVRIDGQLHGES